MRQWKVHLRSDKAIDDLARMWNPVLHGWIQYYGRFSSPLYIPCLVISIPPWSVGPCGNTRSLDGIAGAPYTGSAALLVGSPGCLPTGIGWAYDRRLDDGSRMSGDVHVRFCERPRGRFPRATHLVVCGKAPAATKRGVVEAMMERLRVPVNATKTRSMRVPEEPLEFSGTASDATTARSPGVPTSAPDRAGAV